MPLRIQYTTAPDRARLAYTLAGTGPALVYLPASTCSHLTLLWEQPGMRGFFERLATRRTLVRFDFRGYGLSTRKVADRSLEALVTDLQTVLDAGGIDCVDILTDSHRASVALRFAVANPTRVRRMVLRGPVLYRAPGVGGLPGAIDLMRNNYDLWLQMNAQRSSVGKSITEVSNLVAFFRQCIDPEDLLAEIASGNYFDDWEIARSVTCPVLVVCRSDGGYYPLDVYARFASMFPHGQLVPQPVEVTLPMFAGNSEPLERLLGGFFGMPDVPAVALSPREDEVVALVAVGQSNQEIANALGLSVRTIERHLTNIYNKIGARGRADAVAWALRHRAW